MKSFCKTILFLFIGIHCAFAQDSVVLLSAKMFENNQQIFLSEKDAWLFRQGNDFSWANKEINTAGWRKLKPTELSAKYADKTGKVECWFRLKFKLDPDFGNTPLSFHRGCWAATELYLDGNFVASFGNTGAGAKTYQEYNPIDKLSLLSNLDLGKEHLLAIHLVDYVSPFPPRKLKSETSGGVRDETSGLKFFVVLTGPEYNLNMLNVSKGSLFLRSIFSSVTFLLTLLFWLLFFLNPGERKTLLLIAIYSSFSALSNLTRFPLTDPDISFISFEVNDLVQKICLWMMVVMIFVTTKTILNFKLFRSFRPFIIVYSLLGVLSVFFEFFFRFWAINVMVGLLVIVFLLISSRKKLKGAQWAIAIGLLLSILFGALMVIFALSKVSPKPLLLIGFYLAFPLSLVVYVSMRFREIIRDVSENARQIVQMTEEKKEQAVKQQKILEEEVARQTAEIRTTLTNLKSTQAQLIQAEKMASLGELTAGIAHEIQNPLNFVNNFSELNKEMLGELKAERSKPNVERNDQLEDELINDVIDNSEKINHHGKRADAIVKGMLQHSRTSSGQRELTDINELADEYLRLAYHGLRAKDKTFNVKIETDFDPNVGKLNVVPQDIGRVLLNLINNAFYAAPLPRSEGAGFLDSHSKKIPSVWVKTLKVLPSIGRQPRAAESFSGGARLADGEAGGGVAGCILISVRDNGPGIPANILDKIFQPFFTTKPTGEGTGLGLSLSYDIITKGHGGELKVETKDGEGTTFIVQLPSPPTSQAGVPGTPNQ